MRLPLWLLYYFNLSDTYNDIQRKLSGFRTKYDKTKFCSLIASHDSSGIRAQMVDFVSTAGHVDCAGRFMCNDDTLKTRFNDDKAAYLRQYRFNICPENSAGKGYVTEKLYQSFYSGCIPIYWGWNRNPEPDVVNQNALLYYEPDADNSELLKMIEELNNNPAAYKDFVNQDYFTVNAAGVIYETLQNTAKRLTCIAGKAITIVN